MRESARVRRWLRPRLRVPRRRSWRPPPQPRRAAPSSAATSAGARPPLLLLLRPVSPTRNWSNNGCLLAAIRPYRIAKIPLTKSLPYFFVNHRILYRSHCKISVAKSMFRRPPVQLKYQLELVITRLHLLFASLIRIFYYRSIGLRRVSNAWC